MRVRFAITMEQALNEITVVTSFGLLDRTSRRDGPVALVRTADGSAGIAFAEPLGATSFRRRN